MKNWAYWIVVLFACGCTQTKEPMKVTPPPKPPPPVPVRQDIPIDPALRDSAKQELMTALASNDPIMRANAIEAIQDTLGNTASSQIMRALGDSDPLVRFAASMAAGRIKLRAAQPALLGLVNDADHSVQVGSRFALHQLGDTRLSHDFERLAVDRDRYVRGNTAIAIGLLGEPSGMRILRGMEADREAVVRLQVAEAEWRLGDAHGLETLVAGTVSGHPDDQIISVWALAGPRDLRVAKHIRGRLVSDYPEIGLVAARAMGTLGSDEGYGVALAGAKSADPRLKALAALAFGSIGRADAQLVLRPMLADPSPQVRLASATAILQLKSH